MKRNYINDASYPLAKKRKFSLDSENPIHLDSLKNIIKEDNINLLNEETKDLKWKTLSTKENKVLLYYAATKNSIKTFEFLIKKIQPDYFSLYGNITHNIFKTPLFHAVKNDSLSCVELLLNQKTLENSITFLPISRTTRQVLNSCNFKGIKLLSFAILNESLEVTKYLLSLPEISKKEKDNAFKEAIIVGNTELINIFLTFNNDINAPLENELTPLAVALKYNQIKIFKILFQYSNISQESYSQALNYAIINNNKECIKDLLNKSDINYLMPSKWTAFGLAIFYNNIELINYFLEVKASLSPYTIDQAFKEAIIRANEKVVTSLFPLIKKIDDFPVSEKLLIQAVKYNYTEIITFLLTQVGLFKQNTKNYALKYAIKNQNMNIITILLEKGAKLNIENSSDSHIHKFNFYELIPINIWKFLLQQRAISFNNMNKIIQNAAQEGQIELIKLILPYYKQKTLAIPKHFSPLEDAAINGHFDIVRLLVNEFKISSYNIDNALISAAIDGHYNIVEFLIDYTDLTYISTQGHPIYHAALIPDRKMVELILDKTSLTSNIKNSVLKEIIKFNNIECLNIMLQKMEINLPLCTYIGAPTLDNENYSIITPETIKVLLAHGALIGNISDYFKYPTRIFEYILLADIIDNIGKGYFLKNEFNNFKNFDFTNNEIKEFLLKRLENNLLKKGLHYQNFNEIKNDIIKFISNETTQKILLDFYNNHASTLQLFELTLLEQIEKISPCPLDKLFNTQFGDISLDLKRNESKVFDTIKFYQKLYSNDSDCNTILDKVLTTQEITRNELKYIKKVVKREIGKYLREVSESVLKQAISENHILFTLIKSSLNKVIFFHDIKIKFEKIKQFITEILPDILYKYNEELYLQKLKFETKFLTKKQQIKNLENLLSSQAEEIEKLKSFLNEGNFKNLSSQAFKKTKEESINDNMAFSKNVYSNELNQTVSSQYILNLQNNVNDADSSEIETKSLGLADSLYE